MPARIFRAVDESEKIAVIEVAEAVHLVDRGHCAAETTHDLRGDLEAQVHPLGADMEQKVARGSDGVARSGPELAEGVKLSRARVAEQPVPGVGPNPHHAGKPGFEIAKFDRSNQARKVGAERARRGATVGARVYRHDQEDRGAGERRRNRLCNRDGVSV